MYKNWLYTWDYMLELYQEVIYVVAPYICTEEPRLMFHKSEQWYPQQLSIDRYDTTYPRE